MRITAHTLAQRAGTLDEVSEGGVVAKGPGREGDGGLISPIAINRYNEGTPYFLSFETRLDCEAQVPPPPTMTLNCMDFSLITSFLSIPIPYS